MKTYDRMRLHLPKKFCELPYVKFAPETPAYPRKQEYIFYLDAYAKHFSIDPVLGVEVRLAKYDSTMGFWHAQSNEFEFVFQWFIVATRENAESFIPDIPGISHFGGKVFHSSSYGNGADFKEEDVLLHVLPREMFGISTFELSMWLLKRFPLRLVDRFLVLCSWLILGDTGRLGFKRPEIGSFELKNSTGKTPVLDFGTIAKVKAGQIKVVPAIKKFTATGAGFSDGTKAKFDYSIIFATGYRSNVVSWLKVIYSKVATAIIYLIMA
ncbi:Indole-3-pyruvate monooxygenase yucca2 [Thalictrum thalictroides]|uniref:indole-3-pyruvate monooxygenase n=1 Tax=Thalictrum thalictroides TaxID=46969 RepID=A0A7J6VN54_THATH|nr:Indole-3-pyruvate monooxygenase yucca2 [Thalictrum thalictroides]